MEPIKIIEFKLKKKSFIYKKFQPIWNQYTNIKT